MEDIWSAWWFGTWMLWLSIYWEFHHPNWRIHIFQRGRYTRPYTTNQWLYDDILVVYNYYVTSVASGTSWPILTTDPNWQIEVVTRKMGVDQQQWYVLVDLSTNSWSMFKMNARNVAGKMSLDVWKWVDKMKHGYGIQFAPKIQFGCFFRCSRWPLNTPN